jgi:hypothetical protein
MGRRKRCIFTSLRDVIRSVVVLYFALLKLAENPSLPGQGQISTDMAPINMLFVPSEKEHTQYAAMAEGQ